MKVASLFKKYRFFILCSIIFVGALAALALKAKQGEALGLMGFGGAVASVTVCTCSIVPTYYVVVGPPSGGEYILPTATAVPYQTGNVWGVTGGTWMYDTYVPAPSGPWILGAYTPGDVGACLMLGEPCYPLIGEGIISLYGTSAGAALSI